MEEPKWQPVIIESPYKSLENSSVDDHRAYLNRAIHDAVMRGETPYASHKMLVDSFDDTNPKDLALGMRAGLSMSRDIISAGGKPVFYVDYGVTEEMQKALDMYESLGVPVERRTIGTVERG